MLEKLRAWGRTYHDEGRFSPVGIIFHWVMAALVLFQIGWGFWTDLMMAGGDKIRAYEVHSAAGLPVLILAIGRFAWRQLMYPGPRNAADASGWKSKVSHMTAIAFYVLFFTLPLSGWVMWSSVVSPGPLYLGGVLPWPEVPLQDFDTEQRFAILGIAEDVHRLSIIALLLLIPAHVGAALLHHFWWKDDVLRGMLPEIEDWEGHPVGQPNRRQAPALPGGSGAG